MFCCSVCNVTFTGVYPESVFSTPCGHLFHTDCIQLCLQKSKCPVCTYYVDKNKLIKIHFQIALNLSDYANDLKKKANNKVVNLEKTLNQTLVIGKNDNESQCNSKNDSLINPEFELDNTIQHDYNSKTLLTTSLCSSLIKEIEDILFIFNHIIPNSTIQKRMLSSENNLIQTALNIGYTNIIIIVVHLGHPVGITLIDLLQYVKIILTLTSVKYNEHGNIKDKIKTPFLVIDEHNESDKTQVFVQTFFKNILSNQSNTWGEDIMNIIHCDNCHAMKFVYSSIGLSFCLGLPIL